MPCKKCGSQHQTELSAEINLHFPGYSGVEKPAILIFPKLFVCLECGYSEFSVPENELPLLNRLSEKKTQAF
jgi:hypothetical protein